MRILRLYGGSADGEKVDCALVTRAPSIPARLDLGTDNAKRVVTAAYSVEDRYMIVVVEERGRILDRPSKWETGHDPARRIEPHRQSINLPVCVYGDELVSYPRV